MKTFAIIALVVFLCWLEVAVSYPYPAPQPPISAANLREENPLGINEEQPPISKIQTGKF